MEALANHMGISRMSALGDRKHGTLPCVSQSLDVGCHGKEV